MLVHYYCPLLYNINVIQFSRIIFIQYDILFFVIPYNIIYSDLTSILFFNTNSYYYKIIIFTFSIFCNYIFLFFNYMFICTVILIINIITNNDYSNNYNRYL